jgi:ATP-binding cassette subfamily A (ABC1) protein 3
MFLYLLRLESQDPSKPSNKAVFSNLFDELDDNKQQFGIDSYGIAITTMEDVFLKVGTELEVEKNATKNVKSLETSEEKSSIKLKGSELFFQRFFGLFMKRYELT